MTRSHIWLHACVVLAAACDAGVLRGPSRSSGADFSDVDASVLSRDAHRPVASDGASPDELSPGGTTDSITPPADSATPVDSSPPPSSCAIFPPDNPWNTDISAYPVHANSAAFVASVGTTTGLHPDFGEGTNGIPFVVVAASQPAVPINFTDYGDESDPGPYPIPLDAPIEDGLDQHVIAVDLTNCVLYELYNATPSNGGWDASCGAVFDLTTNDLRPIGWTSADAAGLPIFPGLVRYEEVATGAIDHALRFTVSSTQRAYVLPATHWASSKTDPDLPPMGLRFRLKASVDISGFSSTNQVILKALKKYGMIVADNGADWLLTGAPNSNWNDNDLLKLRSGIKGSDFEVVDTGPIHTSY